MSRRPGAPLSRAADRRTSFALRCSTILSRYAASSRSYGLRTSTIRTARCSCARVNFGSSCTCRLRCGERWSSHEWRRGCSALSKASFQVVLPTLGSRHRMTGLPPTPGKAKGCPLRTTSVSAIRRAELPWVADLVAQGASCARSHALVGRCGGFAVPSTRREAAAPLRGHGFRASRGGRSLSPRRGGRAQDSDREGEPRAKIYLRPSPSATLLTSSGSPPRERRLVWRALRTALAAAASS